MTLEGNDFGSGSRGRTRTTSTKLEADSRAGETCFALWKEGSGAAD